MQLSQDLENGNIVMHHPRQVEKKVGMPSMLCEESQGGRVFGMIYAERTAGRPWSEPIALPVMYAWIKDNIKMPTEDAVTLVFPQCGNATSEVAILRLLVADGLRVRRAIFMDLVMELIDLDQFADLPDAIEIHLFRRYSHLNSYLAKTRPANLVMLGIHSRMFIVGFPYADYLEFCRLCAELGCTPYVNLRHLTFVGDFATFSAHHERLVQECPRVVVRTCGWADEMKSIVEQGLP
jgi:hypothetical protein